MSKKRKIRSVKSTQPQAPVETRPKKVKEKKGRTFYRTMKRDLRQALDKLQQVMGFALELAS